MSDDVAIGINYTRCDLGATYIDADRETHVRSLVCCQSKLMR